MLLTLTRVTTGLLLLTACAFSEPKFTVEKTLYINGAIQQGNILPLGVKMVELSKSGQTDVDLVINSPGGEIITGNLFLNLMRQAQANGLRVTCYVPALAASMAFQILIHCDERHTLSGAFLLWHRARVFIGGGMFGGGRAFTGPEAVNLGKSLLQADADIIRSLRKKLLLPQDVVDYHFEQETLHTGEGLHAMSPYFITAHDAIGNLLEFVLEQSTSKNGMPDNKKQTFEAREGEIVYIHPEFMER